MNEQELQTDVRALLETHDVANIVLDEFDIPVAQLKLSASEGGVQEVFGGKQPNIVSRLLLVGTDISAVKQAIDAESEQGAQWLGIIESYEEKSAASTHNFDVDFSAIYNGEEPIRSSRTDLETPYIIQSFSRY